MQAQAVRSYALDGHEQIIGEGNQQYVLRVRDIASDDRPREKMLRLGPQELTMAELIAIVWGVGTRKEEVLSMAGRLLKEYGERTIATERNPQHLAGALGIPESKACQIIASFELGRRHYERRAGQPTCVRTAAQAHLYLKAIALSEKEQLRALYLNSRYEVVRDEVVSIGSMTANIVHPREVFQPAIQYGAVAVIVAHNHPSGSLEPTTADIEVTQQLIAAGRVLGIELLDHLIISAHGFKSLMEVTL